MRHQLRYALSEAILKDVADLTGNTIMARFCSWCGSYEGLKDGKGHTGPTHTICAACREENLKYKEAGE